ncbi:MAG: RagB/SusD family nutrient uptake outer membrane protein [Lewinellaceae bacterium]|nr:RagB/SusD family nutrient uptake outer membrane protein [Lewinellaceae bacterium]
MKKVCSHFLLILAAIAAVSCESILDKEPLGQLDADTFFKSSSDAVQAINAAYEYLLFSSENNNFYWAFGTVASDNAIAGGDGSRPGIVEIDFLTQTPRTQEFNDFWKLSYSGITQCNTVIEKIPGIDMDESLKDRIVGEALFLRAYYYFGLTQVFGGVPLMTEVLAPEDLKIAQSPPADILRQVVEDCMAAADLLPVEYAPANIGRATRGAAYGLAAKAHLYLKNWDGVLEYVSKVKGLGIYALMPDYLDNFREYTQNNSESVWEIQHDNLELGVGNSLNQWWASKKFSTGYGFAEVTQDFVDEFEAGDPRLKFTVAMNNDPYFGLIYKPSYSSTGYGARKYLQPDSTASQKADGDINYTAIRYAEVLLWEAEALANLGRVAEAQAPLEEVRARARAQAADPETALPPVTMVNQQEMIEHIRHERRVELGFEMHRFFDLVRWGIADQEIEEFQPGKNEVYPIPQTELDLNPNLRQNPGY